jgi:hypothetical protein
MPPMTSSLTWSFWSYLTKSSSLCYFLQSTIMSYLFGTNILLNILFPNTLNIRDQFSHTYEATSNINI